MAKENMDGTVNVDYQEVNPDGTVNEEEGKTPEPEKSEKKKETLFEKHPRFGFGVKVVLVTLTAGAGAFAAYKFGKNIKHEASRANKVAAVALGKAKEASDAVKRLEGAAPVVQNVIESVPEEVVPEVIDTAKNVAETAINNN